MKILLILLIILIIGFSSITYREVCTDFTDSIPIAPENPFPEDCQGNPPTGEICSDFTDSILITSENPFPEDCPDYSY